MGNCSKCGATLVTKARFCAACGSPVTSGPTVPPPTAGRKAEAADPFASTILGDAESILSAQAAVAAIRPTTGAQPAPSPMAASVMKQEPTPVPPVPRQSQPPAANPGWNAQPAAPAAPPQPPAHLRPGSLVLVYWADGNQYPGTVLQVSPYHVLVAFPNGGQQWIEQRYVTSGR